MAKRLALSMATISIVAICGVGYGETPDAAAPSKKAGSASAAPSIPRPRSYKLLSKGNIDYPGNDITYWRGPFSECAAACTRTPGCKAYILHKDNGANCWLKSKVENSTPNTNRDTFQVNGIGGYSRVSDGNIDYPGNDITYWRGPFSGCAAACTKTPGCKAYTLHKDNGANCWLKSKIENSTPNTNRDTFQVQD